MTSWIYDEKFPTGMEFLFETSSFTAAHDDDLNKKSDARWRSWAPGSTIRRVVHDDDLEHPTHEQEARRTTAIGFEFPQSLKNSVTTFQVAVRTLSTTTQSFGLVLTKIRTMEVEE
jgi:hypothetical protein